MSERWQDRADCIDMPLEWFFELYESHAETARDVDAICSACPVFNECLAAAVNTDNISTTGVRAGRYFVLGKVSKTKNSHKSPEQFAEAVREVDEIKED